MQTILDPLLYRLMIAGLFLTYQLPARSQGLLLGERCPDVPLAGWLSGGERTTLAAWTQKPILLCFWNKDCGVAYEFLPYLQNLQTSHPGLQVLVASHQNKDVVEKAFREKALLAAVHLPLLAQDTVLAKLFPHRVEPHVIWLDKDRMVRGITGYEAVQAQNVDAFVGGENLAMPLKQEVMDKDVYFSRTPLMVNQYNETKSKLQSYSYFGSERPSVLSHMNLAYYDTAAGTLRIKAINGSLRRLYQVAYQQLGDFH